MPPTPGIAAGTAGRTTDAAGSHRLADGRVVVIRALRPDDEAAARRFVAELSAETRYARFQKWIAEPTERLLRFLMEVDQQRHVALVCTHDDGKGERIVGEGRYVVQDDGVTCEFGIVVADDWRRTGVAGLLMLALIDTARRRGLRRIFGVVLHGNRAMLKFSRALGFAVEPDPAERETVLIAMNLGTR
jgi:acetyltransferase